MAVQSEPARVLCPKLNLLPPNTRPDLYQSELAHFTSVPWTSALLSTPRTIPFLNQGRNPASPRHDQLLGATLATERGLRHMLCFFTPEDEKHLHDPDRPITKTATLYELGDGLSGYPGVMHGGMSVALADEAMAGVLEINAALGKRGPAFTAASVTGSMESKFIRPIPLGANIVVNCWLENMDGRKTRILCDFRDKEGTELARFASTWVVVRAKV